MEKNKVEVPLQTVFMKRVVAVFWVIFIIQLLLSGGVAAA